MKRQFATLAAALMLGGCASTYHLTLMPRDSGKLYEGVARQTGDAEGTLSITIEGRTFTGTWVETAPGRTTAWVSGAGATRRSWLAGGTVTIDDPRGAEAKALLRSPDGAGLRCDLRGGSRAGGGVCRDDKGLEYDVQVRPAGP